MCLRQSLPLECNYSPFNHFQASARVAGQLPGALATHHFLMDTTISTGTCSCSSGRMLLGGWLLCDLKLQKHHILLKPQCQSPAYGKNSRGGRMAPPHQGSDLGPRAGLGMSLHAVSHTRISSCLPTKIGLLDPQHKSQVYGDKAIHFYSPISV